MTTKAKAQAEEATAEQVQEPAKDEDQAPPCGVPHYLPMLAHLTCQLPAPDPDLPPGTPEHEHRYQDGDAIYVWR